MDIIEFDLFSPSVSASRSDWFDTVVMHESVARAKQAYSKYCAVAGDMDDWGMLSHQQKLGWLEMSREIYYDGYRTSLQEVEEARSRKKIN